MAGGCAFFRELTTVDADWEAKRTIVLSRKQPRPLFVQAHTRIDPDSGDVRLVEFEASYEGVIQSYLARYS
jgi:deoxycytidine triphosphate deaminase